MPWVLLALVAGAGGLYYQVNKKSASVQRWELHFPASSAIILSGLMDAVTPVGGTVLDIGNGVYVVNVPAKVDLSHTLPPNLIPQNMVVSGDPASYGPGTSESVPSNWNLQSWLQSDDRMPAVDDMTGQPPWIPPGPVDPIVAGESRRGASGIKIAGMRWDGKNLR